MQKYSEVFFDLDGTIIYSDEGIVKATRYALLRKNIEEPDTEKLLQFIGPPLYHSFEKYYGFSEQESNELVEYYREYYDKKGIYEYTIIPGMDKLIKKLHEIGTKVYLATGKPHPYAEQIIREIGITQYFSGIVGSNLDGTQITKPEVLEAALKMAKPQNPVMVGDSCYDIIAANQFSIDSIAVTFGYGTEQSLKIESPTFIADSVKKLEEILL